VPAVIAASSSSGSGRGANITSPRLWDQAMVSLFTLQYTKMISSTSNHLLPSGMSLSPHSKRWSPPRTHQSVRQSYTSRRPARHNFAGCIQLPNLFAGPRGRAWTVAAFGYFAQTITSSNPTLTHWRPLSGVKISQFQCSSKYQKLLSTRTPFPDR
jgi:hypothetical protein